jgi:Holliday junction resolvasome RuvABC ATP-dependent DNA helicase subunit
MTNHLNGNNSLEMQSKLNQFKEYAVLHHHLARIDKLLMRAIREPAGFAHVLVYGPSGVGKTTMIRQIAKRLNEDLPERSLGCVGVLKDWLIRAVAAALDDGNDTLSLERLHEHTLSLAQCERMALDTTEGEQKLSYMESRHEHLWHLLQIGMDSTSVPRGKTWSKLVSLRRAPLPHLFF